MTRFLTFSTLLFSATIASGAIHDVTIASFAFQPDALTIQAGDTVRWTNGDFVSHTSTSDSGIWDSGIMSHGQQFSFAFTEAGYFEYHCSFHPSMTGNVNVESGGMEFQWEYLDSPTSLPINGVFFIDADRGWAAGDQGVLRTTDGGDSWSIYATNDDVMAVHFIDIMEGWACGNDGMILHSTDGGASWTPQPSGVAEKLRDIRMADGIYGWTAGRDGILRRTTNGGASWFHQTNPAVDDLRGIAILDVSNAWVVGSDGMILHTTNGGTNWNSQPSGTAQELNGVSFINGQRGWTCGNAGIILKTTNGGTSWVMKNSGTNQNIQDIYFVDAMNGWAVGDAGLVIFSTDGGEQWADAEAGIFSGLLAVHFVNTSLGFVTGLNGIIVRYSEVPTGIDEYGESERPRTFSLGQNYPNPFNAQTQIPFRITEAASARLEIFDVTGRLIGSLLNEYLEPGTYSVNWDTSRLGSGVYFYRLITAGGSETRRMTILK